MMRALKALERLREGNARFVADIHGRDSATSPARRHEVAAGQEPFAILLGVLMLAWANDDEREQRRRDRAATIKGSAEADAIEDYNAMLGRLPERDSASPR